MGRRVWNVFLPSEIETESRWVCAVWSGDCICIVGSLRRDCGLVSMRRTHQLLLHRFRKKTNFLFVQGGAVRASFPYAATPFVRLRTGPATTVSPTRKRKTFAVRCSADASTACVSGSVFFEMRNFFLLHHTENTLFPATEITKLLLGAGVATALLFGRSFASAWLITKIAVHIENPLRNTIKWLMGWPAGLKLNPHLNKFLGELSLFFLDISHVFYEGSLFPNTDSVILVLCLCFLSNFPAGIHLLDDTFALYTANISSAYRASKLLLIGTLSVCGELLLVLVGRRNNVLKKRKDYAAYEVEVVLLAAFFFVLNLFLLPTIFTYFLVFAFFHIPLAVVRSALHAFLHTLCVFPLRKTVLYFFNRGFQGKTTGVAVTSSGCVSLDIHPPFSEILHPLEETFTVFSKKLASLL
ncbi:MAG: Gpi1-domain-containing protein [Amphiamblys sp. WSBS2006]|nr:MAG: Gpi1-domain-containing protein [Amphiamblys sp. WSBS2006]